MAQFEQAIPFVLRWEGGETVDSGGYTKFGISQNAYPNLNIAALTIEDAKAIYRRDYWNKILGDQIRHQENALALFDYAVNAGPGRAVQDAQRVLNARGASLAVDGGMGPKTLAAINQRGPAFAGDLTRARMGFYNRLVQMDPAKYGIYLKGWMRRANDLMSHIPKAANLLVPLIFAAGMLYLLKR
jgi:lysozyme family protein